jgi:hypothetical protein
MTALADNLVPDKLWAVVEPLLPVPSRPPYGGRRRAISDRACSPRSCSWPHFHPMAAAAGPRAGLRLTGDLLAPA